MADTTADTTAPTADPTELTFFNKDTPFFDEASYLREDFRMTGIASTNIANGYKLTIQGWTKLSKYGLMVWGDGVGHAYVHELKKNTQYFISVYQRIPSGQDTMIKTPGSSTLAIGTANNMKDFVIPTRLENNGDKGTQIENQIVESDCDGKIFLEFRKTSSKVYFSGLGVSLAPTKNICIE